MLSTAEHVDQGAQPAPARGAYSAAEQLAFLALASIKGVGQKTLRAIVEADKRFADVLAIEDTEAAIDLLRGFGARIDGSSGANWDAVRRQALERADRLSETFLRDGTIVILRSDPRFPRALLDLASPPCWLFVRGSVEAMHRPAITVVGTRQPSEDGQFLTRYAGACFSDWGAPTVSGLAVGVDQLVHELSLRARVPTIAFLGTGILSDYPRGASQLKDRIVAEGGALVTEYLPRESYSAENFVNRNRLQAALGRVLIPTEWSPRSGTAHTVRFATSLRRPIACLRLSDWAPDRVLLAQGMGQETGHVFTIPGDEPRLRQFVDDALTAPLPTVASSDEPQLRLFAD